VGEDADGWEAIDGSVVLEDSDHCIPAGIAAHEVCRPYYQIDLLGNLYFDADTQSSN
jgi:hypothetical protein